jgi:hypothetical protein
VLKSSLNNNQAAKMGITTAVAASVLRHIFHLMPKKKNRQKNAKTYVNIPTSALKLKVSNQEMTDNRSNMK